MWCLLTDTAGAAAGSVAERGGTPEEHRAGPDQDQGARAWEEYRAGPDNDQDPTVTEADSSHAKAAVDTTETSQPAAGFSSMTLVPVILIVGVLLLGTWCVAGRRG